MSSISPAVSAEARPSRALHISLWCVQVLLGAMFLMAGSTKGLQPMEALAAQMPWTAEVGAGLTRFIGYSELLGGLGLILPALLRIRPRLTALAAAALVVVMVLAAIFHITRGEFAGVGFNAILGGLAAFVAWGRFKKAPITPRG